MTAAVILAGGASRRMGSPKALLMYEGETFVDRLVGIFNQVCEQVIVVLGANAELIHAGLKRPATFVINQHWEQGQLSSLQCGLRAVDPTATRSFFMPVDYPAIQASTVQALNAAWRPEHLFVIPRYADRRGHPILSSAEAIEQLLALPQDATARDVVHGHVNRTCYVDVPDEGILLDVDDPAAYAHLLQVTG